MNQCRWCLPGPKQQFLAAIYSSNFVAEVFFPRQLFSLLLFIFQPRSSGMMGSIGTSESLEADGEMKQGSTFTHAPSQMPRRDEIEVSD